MYNNINYRYYSRFEFQFFVFCFLFFLFFTESANLKHLHKPFPSVMDFNSWNIVWSLCFGLLATLIIVGNLLTIWIFLKQRLRKRTHFFLISLAVADLLVGLLTVPLYIAFNKVSYFGQLLGRSVFKFTDIFTAIASISTLAAISFERMYAVGWPFRHRNLNFRVYMFAIAIPWILAAIFTSISLLRHLSIITLKDYMFCLILFLSTPLLVMCITYFVVWRKQKTMMGNRNHVVREKRLAKTLFIIIAASLLTWLPFQILSLLIYFGVILPYFNATLFIITFLQFSNSLVNVTIYPFRITEFKNALRQMLCCCTCVCPRDEKNEVAPMHQGRVGHFHRFQEIHIPNH